MTKCWKFQKNINLSTRQCNWAESSCETTKGRFVWLSQCSRLQSNMKGTHKKCDHHTVMSYKFFSINKETSQWCCWWQLLERLPLGAESSPPWQTIPKNFPPVLPVSDIMGTNHGIKNTKIKRIYTFLPNNAFLYHVSTVFLSLDLWSIF